MIYLTSMFEERRSPGRYRSRYCVRDHPVATALGTVSAITRSLPLSVLCPRSPGRYRSRHCVRGHPVATALGTVLFVDVHFVFQQPDKISVLALERLRAPAQGQLHLLDGRVVVALCYGQPRRLIVSHPAIWILLDVAAEEFQSLF